MGEKNIPDNKTRTKSALVSLSEEIENVADKVSQSVVSVHSKKRKWLRSCLDFGWSYSDLQSYSEKSRGT